jgi:uncharacterized HAD superfamily protein
MKIGIDIDDTITNSYDLIISKLCEVSNINKDYIINNKLSYRDLYKENITPSFLDFSCNTYESIIPTVDLKNNVKEVIDELHNMGYIIEIVTARNHTEYKDPYQISYDYLTSNNIYFDKINVNVHDKGIFCKENNIDILIDDSVRNVTNAYNMGIKTILFENIYNKHTNRFTKAKDWLEVLTIIKNNEL